MAQGGGQGDYEIDYCDLRLVCTAMCVAGISPAGA